MTRPSPWQLHNAARWIRCGGVVAYPTEAVYGLGCDPANRAAVERILRLKRRHAGKGLILIASSWQQLQPWLQPIPAAWRDRLNKDWPGPITWLIPATADCPAWLTGAHDTLAVRITAHPPARALCDAVHSAIVSTSANRAGQRPARSVLDLRLKFGYDIDYVLPGKLGAQRRPTRIRDLASARVLRQ
jgi:L-threonylcarbamoyladenylate synthase